MKALGVMPGVFDLVVMAPGGFTGFIEVKAGKGKLSEDQEVFRRELLLMGFPYVIARSLDDVRAAIEAWQLPNRLAKC